MYHFKVVLLSDVQALQSSLRSAGIVEPTEQSSNNDVTMSDGSQSQDAPSPTHSRYHGIVAQSIYKLPTAWPSTADFLVDLNNEKQVISPKEEVWAPFMLRHLELTPAFRAIRSWMSQSSYGKDTTCSLWWNFKTCSSTSSASLRSILLARKSRKPPNIESATGLERIRALICHLLYSNVSRLVCCFECIMSVAFSPFLTLPTMSLFVVSGWNAPTKVAAAEVVNSKKRKRAVVADEDAKVQTATVNLEKLMRKLDTVDARTRTKGKKHEKETKGSRETLNSPAVLVKPSKEVKQQTKPSQVKETKQQPKKKKQNDMKRVVEQVPTKRQAAAPVSKEEAPTGLTALQNSMKSSLEGARFR